MTYTLRTSSNAGSQPAKQVHAVPGTHYDPWQQAKLTNGSLVWITRQNGDGENVFYWSHKGEKIAEAQIQEWL